MKTLFNLLKANKWLQVTMAVVAAVIVCSSIFGRKTHTESTVASSSDDVIAVSDVAVTNTSVCSVCYGTGACEACSGLGDYLIGDTFIQCWECKGSGRCYLCGGDGSVSQKDSEEFIDDINSKLYPNNNIDDEDSIDFYEDTDTETKVHCSACGGTGKIEKTGHAINFGSSADTSYTYYETCTVCGGSGYCD